MGFLSTLMAAPWFATLLTGAGFFGDSYDLFVTDGVTTMLKDLGPVTKVVYRYNTSATTSATLVSYFTALCVDTVGTTCLPRIYNTSQGAWVPNPGTVWTPDHTPHYQLQSAALKNGVSNAALIGSITGQLVFGFAGDVLGRKWCFVLTTLLIILGCLGSATAAAGVRVGGVLNAAGAWGDAGSQPSSVSSDVYTQLMIWRALLGFGVGGEYPLAGTIASEGAKSTGARGKSVLYTFSMQGWGKLTASLVNYTLVRNLTFFGGAWALDNAWRFALAFGCILNLLTAPFRFIMEESHIFTEKSQSVASKVLGGGDEGSTKKSPHLSTSQESAAASGAAATTGISSARSAWGGRGGGEEVGEEKGEEGEEEEGGASTGTGTVARPPPSAATATATATLTPPPDVAVVAAASKTTMATLWECRWTLVGTASTWFLIDVTFYGQSLMNTTVVAEAVSSTVGLNSMEKLRSSLLSTVWIMLIAIPGYFIAIALVDGVGRKPLQRYGFLACAALFLVLGCAYDTPLRTGGGGGGFVLLYGLTYLASNAGPNSVTFLMPAEAFPTLARSTAHGISAAFGKVGATVGAFGLLFIFTGLGSGSAGVVAVMLVCAGVALLGAFMNEVFCKETGGVSLQDVDSRSSSGSGSGSGKGGWGGEGGGKPLSSSSSSSTSTSTSTLEDLCPSLRFSGGGGEEEDEDSTSTGLIGKKKGTGGVYGATADGSSSSSNSKYIKRGMWPES